MAWGPHASAPGSEAHPHAAGGGHGSAVDLEAQSLDSGGSRQHGSQEWRIPDAQMYSFPHSWCVGVVRQTARLTLHPEVRELQGGCTSKGDSDRSFVEEDTSFAAEDTSYVAEDWSSAEGHRKN